MAARISFRDILNDLKGEHVRDEMRGDWAIALLYRLPSPVFTWLFARFGWTPIGVSSLGLVISLAMPLEAFFLPLWLAPWIVFASAVLFQILDCVDGSLARASEKASLLGADLDYLFGMIHYLCLYPAIGLLADRFLDSGYLWTALAGVAVAGRLLARLVREQVGKRIPDGKPGPFKVSDLPLAFVAGLSGLIAFGALAGSYGHWVVTALLVYSLLDVVEAFLPMKGPPYTSS